MGELISPHYSSELHGIIECGFVGPVFFTYHEGDDGPPKGSLSCYRALLCEKEKRDCFMALPMLTDHTPFDWEKVVDYLKEHGRRYDIGLDSVALLRDSRLSVQKKRQILKEFLEFPEELLAPIALGEEDIKNALAKIKDV